MRAEASRLTFIEELPKNLARRPGPQRAAYLLFDPLRATRDGNPLRILIRQKGRIQTAVAALVLFKSPNDPLQAKKHDIFLTSLLARLNDPAPPSWDEPRLTPKKFNVRGNFTRGFCAEHHIRQPHKNGGFEKFINFCALGSDFQAEDHLHAAAWSLERALPHLQIPVTAPRGPTG